MDNSDKKQKKKQTWLPKPAVALLSNSINNELLIQLQAKAAVGRIAMGMAGAAYVLVVLMATMVMATVVGVGLVRWWGEEAVYVRENVQFDYSEPHPTALLLAPSATHPAHTIYVSLALFMPDSDYNRDIGIFQLSAELISTEGNVIARSSHPRMLRFRSWPIRYARTFVLGVPLLLGIITETQTLTFPALKHKEAAYPRTHHIRITLIPRAGTFSLPHFYDAQIIFNSRPPCLKEMAYRWRLTLCVWTTFYVFMMLLMFLLLFMKPLLFPRLVALCKLQQQEPEEEDVVVVEESSSSTDVALEKRRSRSRSPLSLERWQRSRRIKRKAAEALLHGSSSPSTTTITLKQGSGYISEESSVCS